MSTNGGPARPDYSCIPLVRYANATPSSPLPWKSACAQAHHEIGLILHDRMGKMGDAEGQVVNDANFKIFERVKQLEAAEAAHPSK